MRTFARSRILAFGITLALVITLAGCGSKTEGTYFGDHGTPMLELKSGKATLSSPGKDQTWDYTVQGDTITLQSKKDIGEDMTFTIMKDGSLQGKSGTFLKTID